MKNLRTRGSVATAITAAAAMVLSTIAIAPANAADSVCDVSTQESFEKALNGTCSTIVIAGDHGTNNEVLAFNYGPELITAGVLWGNTLTGYGKVATEKVTRDVTITTAEDGNDVIMRNVQFDVQSGAHLTFAGKVVLDNAELAGISIGGLIGLGTSGTPAGIDYGVRVAGNAAFTMNDFSRMAVGAGNRTSQANRGIVLTGSGATVNLNSTGTYTQKGRAGLAAIDLSGLGFLGDLVDTLLNPILGLLSFDRTVDYPTVWGRDAAVYSAPGADTAINITNGSYSNQKDTEVTGTHVLNGAVSTSGTVNIGGEGNAVQISSTKIGNAVDSKHNGVETGGTLNVNNSKAQLDPATELDSSARESTDSWAVELRGSATANLVAGSINDTLHTDAPKVIESESGSKVNILAAKQGDVKIANQSYWIGQPKQSGAAFSATTNSTASVAKEDTSTYELWSSNASAEDDTLAQLAELLSSEASSDPAAAKLSTSSYDQSNATISAKYLDATSANGRSVYGRHVIDAQGNSPFQGVNSGTPGTVTLYGLPFANNTFTAPTESGKLFAGWYAGESAWKTEDDIQNQQFSVTSTSDKCVATSLDKQPANPKHHCWSTGAATYPNNGTVGDSQNSTAARIVLNPAKHTGALYPRFVDADTMGVTGVQVANTAKAGTYDLRILSGVDSYNFKNFAFTIKYQKADGSWATFAGPSRTTSKVAYDYVSVSGESGKQVYTDSPYKSADGYSDSVLGDRGDARYLTTVKVNKVPANTTFQVTPQWTTLDGTTVTGASSTFTLKADGKIYK